LAVLNVNLVGNIVNRGRLGIEGVRVLGSCYDASMDPFKPEPKKSNLGQFHPETEMRGRWIGFAALGCLAASLIINELLGMIPGFLLAIAGLVLAKWGLDSKGRLLSMAALVVGVVLLGVYLTVLIVGKESWVM
jgi:hypothetical protein